MGTAIKKFSLIQYTKKFVTAITIFTMVVIFLAFWRNNASAYKLAIHGIDALWKIGGFYMIKSLIETSIERSKNPVIKTTISKIFKK